MGLASNGLGAERTMAEYAGDLSAKEAFALLEQNRSAILVDVRTAAEWSYVGLPNISGLGKETVLVEWQSFPAMSVNPNFVAEVTKKLDALGVTKSTPVVFICRSGARSKSAAVAFTKAGYASCYNLAGGFEGDRDSQGHRNSVNGWRAAGLPWAQS